MGGQKSAEVVVVAETGAMKGRTCHEWKVTRALCVSRAQASVLTEGLRSTLEGPEVWKVIEVPMGQQATRRTEQAQCDADPMVWVTDRKRRMRNRTYGVVGGRPGQPGPLPDVRQAWRVAP